MKVMLFGASGMVGQAVLREFLQASDVEEVRVVVRSPLDLKHPKLKSIVLQDLFQNQALKSEASDLDACLFCLGTSIGDSTEQEYIRLNHELPLSVAETMSEANPDMSFVYISGKGTDSTETGNVLWARIKGKTENSLLKMGFKAVFLIRPALIIPLNGEQSKTPLYRQLYKYTGWLMRAVQPYFPAMITDTEKVGTAILTLIRQGLASTIVENDQINQLAVR